MGIKIPDLASIDLLSVTNSDVLPIVDIESQTTKKISVANLRQAIMSVDNGTNGSNGVILDVSPDGHLSADFNLTALRTKFIATGSLVYNAVTGEFAYTTPNSDGITEGTQHLFYTDERSRAAISVAGAGISYDPQTGVISVAGPNLLSNVQCTGVAGQFSCGSTPLYVGNIVTISGTNTGTATITGYSDPKTYYIVATNGTTTFQLSATEAGPPIVTTAGTTVGLSFLNDTVGGITHISGLIIDNQTIKGQTQGTDVAIDPNGGYVKLLGSLKFNDNSIQTVAFPGYAGWTNNDHIEFTSTDAAKRVYLGLGSNAIFVDASGAHLKAGTGVAQLATTGALTIPGPLIFADSTAQTTAYNLASYPNNSVFFKKNNVLSSSVNLTFANDQLTVPTLNVQDINFTGSGTVDISSNSNMTISATGTLTVNGAYTLPKTAGIVRKVLTTDGVGAATWEHVGANADYTSPNSTTWKSRQYNAGYNFSFVSNTLQNLTANNAVDAGGVGNEILIDKASYPTVVGVPVGAVVTGGGMTNANVTASAEYIADPTKWRLVVDQSGTFTTGTSFSIVWGSAGTGPVTWYRMSNADLNSNQFRGAVVNYHAFVANYGTVVGQLILSYDGSLTVTHTESKSGNSTLNGFNFWTVTSNGIGFTSGNYDTDVIIQWTSVVFTSPDSFN